jgi:hypothetical protein
MLTNNVYVFPRKKRQSRYERTGWREIFPKGVAREFSDFKKLAPHKRHPAKGRIEFMERFIIIHGLNSAVIIDDQNAVIGGHEIIRRARKTRAHSVCAFVAPLKHLGDKWALAEAYKKVNQKRRGEK